MNLIIAILMLGIIVMTHEFGHFLLVKLDRIGVTEFSLGMEPGLFSFEKSGARYSLKILLFSGSCIMLGEDEGITDGSAFNNKSVWVRISVAVARPVSNFILAFGLSVVLIDIMGYDTTRLAGVVDEYPAQVAGIGAGDVIKSINGRGAHSYRDINWYLFTRSQKSPTAIWERIEERGGTERFSTELAPIFFTENNQYMMKVQFSPVPNMVENIGQFPVHGAHEVQYWIHYIFDTSYMMSHGVVPVNDINGPVGIVNAIDVTVDEATPYGMSATILMLINSVILLSTNLGAMNLLPIPALDGGRLVLLIIEAVRGKPIDKEKEGVVHIAGMMVLLAPVMPILFSDIRKLF